MENSVLRLRNNESISEKDKNELEVKLSLYYEIAIAKLPKELFDGKVMNIKAKLGHIFFNIGDFATSLEQYSQPMAQILNIEKDVCVQMIYNYAMIKYQEEQYDEAQSYFKKLILYKESKNEIHSHVLDCDIKYYLGISSFKLGDNDSAVDMLITFIREYHEHKYEHGKYDLSEVHSILGEIYENRVQSKENCEVALLHFTKYIEYKDPNLLVQLESSKNVEGCVDSSCFEILSRLGDLSFRAERFLFAGNCFRETCYLMKSSQNVGSKIIFSLVEKAYVSYTIAKNKEKRSLMLQEIITLMIENQQTFASPISDKGMTRKYMKGDALYWKALSKTSVTKLESQIYVAMANAVFQYLDHESISEKSKIDLEATICLSYEIAIKMLPRDSSNSQVVNIKAKLGNLFFNMGDVDSALEQYSQVTAPTQISHIDKNVFAQMIYNYAMVKYQEEKYVEAQSYYKDLILCKESDEELLLKVPNYEIAYYLGRTSFQLMDYDIALKMLSVFLENCNTNANDCKYDHSKVHFMLGIISQKKANKLKGLNLRLIVLKLRFFILRNVSK